MLLLVLTACTPLSQSIEDKRSRSQWLDDARAGDPEAQYQLARSYCCGIGPLYSTRKALRWYCESAKQGYTPAQVALADLYSDNEQDRQHDYLGKPPVDFVKAYMWYTVAAARGNPDAAQRRHELGNMMNPDIVLVSKQHAARWKQVDCLKE